MNLILLEHAEVDAQGRAALQDARATHALNVLTVDIGRTIRIGLIDGPIGTGIVAERAGNTIVLQCAFEAEPPPRPRIDLLLAVPRPKVMNRLWAQLAALGVGRIMLTNAERVERPYFDTHVLEEAHYRPLLIEGLQQARDTRVPQVSIHRQFRILVEDELDAMCPDTVRLAADPAASAPIGAALAAVGTAGRALLAIGPEGGWNEFELKMLKSRGFVAAGMGPRTLRSDTACIALLALAHERLAAALPVPRPRD